MLFKDKKKDLKKSKMAWNVSHKNNLIKLLRMLRIK